jgi:hypothetical protein
MADAEKRWVCFDSGGAFSANRNALETPRKEFRAGEHYTGMRWGQRTLHRTRSLPRGRRRC